MDVKKRRRINTAQNILIVGPYYPTHAEAWTWARQAYIKSPFGPFVPTSQGLGGVGFWPNIPNGLIDQLMGLDENKGNLPAIADIEHGIILINAAILGLKFHDGMYAGVMFGDVKFANKIEE